MLEEKEIWKDILCCGGVFSGLYEISNLGRVRYKNGRIKKISTTGKSGYPYVSLCVKGKQRTAYIHRLVAEAFIPNPDNKPYIDHINTDKTDFSIDNLRWVTQKENANNPITKKKTNEATHTPEVIARAFETRKKNNTKRTPVTLHQFTLDGAYVASYESILEASRKTGISNGNILAASKGTNRPAAGGFLWSRTLVPPKYEPYRAKRKRVGQYDKEMILIKEWESIKEAAIALGLGISNISRAIYGRNNIMCCGGFRWKFIE